jgi:sugar/nucleoside kinase (ribokinase family)
MNPMRPLAVVGNVNVDLIMGPAEPWPLHGTEIMVDHHELRVGGAAGIVSLAWQALGVDHQIAANVGPDAFGSWLREGIGARANRWSVAASGTTISLGITHPNGERTFFTSRGHLADLDWPSVRDMLEAKRLSGGILLVCGCFLTDRLTAAYDDLFDWADANAIDLALDTGWPLQGWTPDIVNAAKGWIARSRHLLLNEIEIATLTGETDITAAGEALSGLLHSDAVEVVKRGPRGASARAADGRWTHLPAPEVKVVDTIGAGDVFNAGYLRRIADGRSLEEAVAGGIEAASAAVSTSPRVYGLGENA